MKKIVLFICLLLSTSIFAADNLPEKTISPPTLMYDFANLLSPAKRSEINSQLLNFEKQTSIEFAVVFVDKMRSDQDGIDSYKHDLFNKWGIGKKETNNGILLVFSKEDKKAGFEVGYGAEPFFTDVQSADILRNIMSKYFSSKVRKYDEGITQTVGAVISVIGTSNWQSKQEWLAEKNKNKEVKKAAILNGALTMLGFAALIGAVIFVFLRLKKRRERKRAYANKLQQIIDRCKSIMFDIEDASSRILTDAEKIIFGEIKLDVLNTKFINSIRRMSFSDLDRNTAKFSDYKNRLSEIEKNSSKRFLEKERYQSEIDAYKSKISRIDQKHIEDSIKAEVDYHVEFEKGEASDALQSAQNKFLPVLSAVGSLLSLIDTSRNSDDLQERENVLEHLENSYKELQSKIYAPIKKLQEAQSSVKSNETILARILNRVKTLEASKVHPEHEADFQKARHDLQMVRHLSGPSILGAAGSLIAISTLLNGVKTTDEVRIAKEQAERKRIEDQKRAEDERVERIARQKREEAERDARNRRNRRSSSGSGFLAGAALGSSFSSGSDSSYSSSSSDWGSSSSSSSFDFGGGSSGGGGSSSSFD